MKFVRGVTCLRSVSSYWSRSGPHVEIGEFAAKHNFLWCEMVLVNVGNFVCANSNQLGIGKAKDCTPSSVTIEYFVGPGCATRIETVSRDCLSLTSLEPETRVYQPLPDGVTWRAGRVLCPVSAGAYLIRFPNAKQPEEVPSLEVFARCNLPISDPSEFLAARITETPFWHQRRSAFVKATVDQRQLCAGMSGLLSSCIDLEAHQIEVVRRVLQDPVQRYLLADEVGLGKTIEAGVVIRQYVLDHPHDHSVLILVPAHLEPQWRDELTHHFQLGSLLGKSVHILAHETTAIPSPSKLGLVVIDEAHQVAQWVAAPEGDWRRRQFDAFCRVFKNPRLRLLLLSATPTLHSNEAGFQALLHLLDPVVYPLGDFEGFRNRLQRHQTVATLYSQFQPQEDSGSYLEEALEQLTAAFPHDVRLGQLAEELRPFLAYGTAPDAPGREELIRAIRSHVSEAYRLHRRLLRNRRADERIEDLLPGRAGIVRWDYAEPEIGYLLPLLDEWRLAVLVASDESQRQSLGHIFVLFAEAAGYSAKALADLVAMRLEPTTHRRVSAEDDVLVAVPLLPDEVPILVRLHNAATACNSNRRMEALLTGLTLLFNDPKRRIPARAVVFASYPTVAEDVFNSLNTRWPGQVLRHGQPGWEQFLTSPTHRMLVCDRTAEHGLNLHGCGSVLVNFDLPWSPNRIEQRIGRLDRYGNATTVPSVVLVAKDDSLTAAWVDLLDRGYGLFERSVAALQYLTESELQELHRAVLDDGVAAVTAAADRLAGDEGLVETSLQEIQILDELDAVESPLGHGNFRDVLVEAETVQWPHWQDATHNWAGEALQFGRRNEGGPNSDVWRYQFRPQTGSGPSTLMPVSRLLRDFNHIIDVASQRFDPQSPWTYPLTFHRSKAQSRKAALARIGDPFIEALVKYMHWDDRGVCSALWRFRPEAAVAQSAEIAFRFDFIVECSIDNALAALPADGHWSANAIRGQADWLFPPFSLVVWLDQGLESIAEDRLAVFAEGYSKAPRLDGGMDFNLNAERWATIEPQFPRFDWSRQVQMARGAAEQQLRTSSDWSMRIAERLKGAQRVNADRQAQADSRLAFLTGTHQAEERKRVQIEEAVWSALLDGIERPSVRLDSVGAVFLANWNPFTGTDE